jgi:hypothetical protein
LRIEPDAVHILKERREAKKGKSAVYRLTGVGPGGSAVVAKRCQADTGLVERTIYEKILPHLPVSGLGFCGFLEESGGELCWLFLEEARGEAYSPRVAEHRVAAGRWLGCLHTTARSIAAAASLPDRGPNHYFKHLQSACDAVQRNVANPSLSADAKVALLSILSNCEHLESNWQELENLCRTMSSTLVHGDFVEKNIRLQMNGQGVDLLTFDWELAGWGVPVADLAQSPPETRRFSANPDIAAYWTAARDEWPGAALDTLERLAHVGTVFRLLAAINWVAQGLTFGWRQRRISDLVIYESGLSAEVRAAKWRV